MGSRRALLVPALGQEKVQSAVMAALLAGLITFLYLHFRADLDYNINQSNQLSVRGYFGDGNQTAEPHGQLIALQQGCVRLGDVCHGAAVMLRRSWCDGQCCAGTASAPASSANVSSAACNSRWRTSDGQSPSGRSRIITISAAP